MSKEFTLNQQQLDQIFTRIDNMLEPKTETSQDLNYRENKRIFHYKRKYPNHKIRILPSYEYQKQEGYDDNAIVTMSLVTKEEVTLWL